MVEGAGMTGRRLASILGINRICGCSRITRIPEAPHGQRAYSRDIRGPACGSNRMSRNGAAKRPPNPPPANY